MSLLTEDFTLPGVVTEVVASYSQDYDTSLFGTTNDVLVIGTAFNGPTGKIVPIYSPEHARYVFGGSFDSKSKKEATLVSNIQDSWDRGCRTIYALRLSGKDIHKDYQLGVDTDLKLRVSGLFPSNANKDISMLVRSENGNLSVEVYKPAKLATIAEKKQGLVEKQDAVLINRIEISNGGVSPEDELTELITRVNQHSYNNAIRLSIIDSNGNDVTNNRETAAEVKVKHLFSGIYTIARDKNKENIPVDSIVKFNVEEDGVMSKELVINTDISNDLPIFSKTGLNEALGQGGEEYGFLKVTGKIDDIFEKDAIDYEEVGISNFEIYKKLGSGFAINAEIVNIAKEGQPPVYKVKEVANPDFRKTAISDGIYSTLENSRAMYRVLAGVSADAEIKSKLPRPDEFKISAPVKVNALGDAIAITPKISKGEIAKAKSYELIFKTFANASVETFKDEIETIKSTLITDKVIREVSSIEEAEFAEVQSNRIKEKHEEGNLILVLNSTREEGKLHAVKKKKYTSLHNSKALIGTFAVCDNELYRCDVIDAEAGITAFKKVNSLNESISVEPEYAAVVLANGSYVVKKFTAPSVTKTGSGEQEQSPITIETVGTVEQIFNEVEDAIFTGLTSTYASNVIEIKGLAFDYITIDEMVEALKNDKDFSKMFHVEVIDIVKSQNYVIDGILEGGKTVEEVSSASIVIENDRITTFDTSLRIPYRTDDNFARQLAQHCMYTSMKTSATHGVIGVSSLQDTTLSSVAKRVEDLVNLRLDSNLVVKKSNGTNMLDKDNMPYHIGRKISIPVAQYRVTTGDNYSYVSNFAAGYAGMVSALPLDQSSTCQTVNIPTPSYELTNYQLTALTAAGFVTVKNSYTKGYVITDGITMAPGSDALKRLSASRIADAIDVLIRNACEPFIGKQNHLANQNSLNTAINSELSKVVNKLIEMYDFRLVVDSQAAQLGVIDIIYAIVPIYEIKKINNKITVTE